LPPEMRRMSPRAPTGLQRPAGGRARAPVPRDDARDASQYPTVAQEQEDPGAQEGQEAAGPGQSGTPSAAETLFAYGPERLADVQVIGLLLDEPQFTRAIVFLEVSGGLANLLALGPADMVSLGMSMAEAARVSILMEVQRRRTRVIRARINSPEAASAYLLPKAAGLTEERFGLLCLNSRGEVVADRLLCQGTALGLLITPNAVMREALRYGATSVIVWHNHPAGSPEPSREDIAVTKQLQAAGDAIGVPLSDHVIVGRTTCYSFRAAEGWDRRR
jgi:DNA repair protein RadC